MPSPNVVIANEIFVGFDIRPESYYDYKTDKTVDLGTTKLGFATYKENNAAFRRREHTIMSWAKSKQSETLENKPLKGFKISKMVTHGGGWNDLTVHWRIVDPRGFELEISSGNLGKLFQYCKVDHGDIEEACVYGFDKANGSKVVLLPVNSDIYLDSVTSTAIHNAKGINQKNIPLGYKVKLKNGVEGTYMGKQHVVYFDKDTEDVKRGSDRQSTFTLSLKSKEVNLLLVNAIPSITKSYKKEFKVYCYASVDVVEIMHQTHADAHAPLSKESAEKIINEVITSGQAYVDVASSSAGFLQDFVWSSFTKPDLSKIEFKAVETPFNNNDLVFKNDYYSSFRQHSAKFGMIVATDTDHTYSIEYHGSYGRNELHLAKIKCNEACNVLEFANHEERETTWSSATKKTLQLVKTTIRDFQYKEIVVSYNGKEYKLANRCVYS